MSTLNKVMIIGHLGRDPERRYTQNGSPVCSLNNVKARTFLSLEHFNMFKVDMLGFDSTEPPASRPRKNDVFSKVAGSANFELGNISK